MSRPGIVPKAETQPADDVLTKPADAELPGGLGPAGDTVSTPGGDASLAPVWVDRDLSWLEFNRRVLAEALDDRTPLATRRSDRRWSAATWRYRQRY